MLQYLLSFLGAFYIIIHSQSIIKEKKQGLSFYSYYIILISITIAGTYTNYKEFYDVSIFLLAIISKNFNGEQKYYIISSGISLILSEYLNFKAIFITSIHLMLFSLLIQYILCNNFQKTKQAQQDDLLRVNIPKRDSLKNRESITSITSITSTESTDTTDTKSPINDIIQSINYAINLLSKNSDNELTSESIESLNHALKTINKSPNIYSPSLQSITKHMDIEDKIFIEQNTFHVPSFSISDLNSTKPINVNINHEFTYGVSELSGILKQIGKE